MRRSQLRIVALVALGVVLGAPPRAAAQAVESQFDRASSAPDTSAAASGEGGTRVDPVYVPDLGQWLPRATSRESLSASLQILVMLTLLTVAPSIVLMMTSFTRILIVLVLLRQALGTQTLPPSQVLVGLSLFLTMLAMTPTWDKVRKDALDPYLDGRMGQTEAIAAAGGHLRSFMFDQIVAARNEQDVYMMYEYAAQRDLTPDETLTPEQVPMTALLPAYLLSELKAAFVLGFRVYLPFLVIDMVIATVLVSMGMMMLPPVLISLPFKLLLFVLADGWHLIGGSLMASVA
ncbi:MAG: flagellar type III secretion system pore protein FliP [Phycisphaerae bacterium]